MSGGNDEAPDEEDEDDDDDDDTDVEDPSEVRGPNMQPLPYHNIPTYAQKNGAYLSTKRYV
jgi:hypothetical protein